MLSKKIYKKNVFHLPYGTKFFPPLNNTIYSWLNYSKSPQILNTGVRADFNCTFASLEDDYLTQTGFSNYAVSLNKNQYVNFYLLTQLRKEQDAKNQKTHTKKDTNKIYITLQYILFYPNFCS